MAKAFIDCIHWKSHKFSGCIKGLCAGPHCSEYKSTNDQKINFIITK